jgi:hypothetical protein
MNFLLKTREKEGKLWCSYCGKEELMIYGFHESKQKENMATTDHFIPSSKGGGHEKNLVVACNACNSKKRSMIFPLNSLRKICSIFTKEELAYSLAVSGKTPDIDLYRAFCASRKIS